MIHIILRSKGMEKVTGLDKIGLWIVGVIAIGGVAWSTVCLTKGYGGVVLLAAVGIGLLIWEQKRMNEDERNRR